MFVVQTITITATPITVGGNNLQVFVTDININAVPVNPILTITLTLITDNPFSVDSVSVTDQPADISAATPTVTNVACSSAGQPCTQTVEIVHTINTVCPTRSQLSLDEFQYQAQFVCAPVETCGAAPANVNMQLQLTSEDYCPTNVINTLTGVMNSFNGVDQNDNTAYPNNGGSAGTTFDIDETVFMEIEVDNTANVVFSSADIQVIRIEVAPFAQQVVFDQATPAIGAGFGVIVRDTGFTDSGKKSRFLFPIANDVLNIPEGEVLGSNEFSTVEIEADVLIDFVFTSSFDGGHGSIPTSTMSLNRTHSIAQKLVTAKSGRSLVDLAGGQTRELSPWMHQEDLHAVYEGKHLLAKTLTHSSPGAKHRASPQVNVEDSELTASTIISLQRTDDQDRDIASMALASGSTVVTGLAIIAFVASLGSGWLVIPGSGDSKV